MERQLAFHQVLKSIFWIDPLICLATAFFGTISFIVSFFDPSGWRQHRIAQAWGRALVRISRLQLRVEGIERLQPGLPYVLAVNHRSLLDIPVLLAAIPIQFRFLATRGLFKIPFIGGHLSRAGHIMVDRTDPREAIRSLTAAAQTVVKNRVPVLVFPEGGRTRGEFRQFKEGMAYLAIKGQIPIVPIYLHGLYEVLPKGSIIIQPREVHVVVGEPIPAAGWNLRDRQVLTEHVYQAFLKLQQEVQEKMAQAPVPAATGPRAKIEWSYRS